MHAAPAMIPSFTRPCCAWLSCVLFLGSGTRVAASTVGGSEVMFGQVPPLVAVIVSAVLFFAVSIWLIRRSHRLPLKKLSLMMDRAECLLWEATMQMRGGNWNWDFIVQPSALTKSLFADDLPARRERIWLGYETPDKASMDEGCRAAIREGRSDYQIEFRLVRDGVTRWMRESVTIDPLGAGRYRLTGVTIEITALREAEAARREAHERLQKLLSAVDCIVWQASVTRDGAGDLQWQFFIAPSELHRRIAAGTSGPQDGMPWTEESVPEFREIEARSRSSILHGLGGYEQDFRVILGNEVIWLHEKVSISRVSADAWRLDGVVMDVSSQQLAKEARSVSEAQLRQVVESADFMLWHARVFMSADGQLQWALTVPPSTLYRTLFGRDPEPRWPVMPWDRIVGPERRAEMALTTSRAIVDDSPGYEQHIHAQLGERTFWLHERATIKRVGPGEWHLVGIVTDITARQQAEAARLASERTLEEILSRADCLLWRARVVHEEGKLQWVLFDLPKSRLYPALFGEREHVAGAELWTLLDVPDLPEMTRRSATAILSGAPGYEQEFQARREGRNLWLNERVSIRQVAENEWLLVGLVTDLTDRHDAELARRQVEKRLSQLLERADCTIWQADVVRDSAGEFQWSVYIPRSRLYTRIFGEDPSSGTPLDWERMGVPELAEMRTRAAQAFSSRLRGYEQTFHVPKAEGAIWLSEQTSIHQIAEDRWEVVGVVTDITARREAELARMASETQLQQILDHADCLVWQADVERRDGGSFSWQLFAPRSALYRRLFGDEPPPDGLDWPRLRVPELPEMHQRSFQALVSGESGYEQEFRVVADGGVTWLREVVAIVPRGEGRYRLVGVITDISVRRQAELALQESERRFRTLFQHTPVAIIEADFSRVGQWIEQVRAAGVQDIGAWLEENPRRIHAAAREVRVIDANEVAAKMLRARGLNDFRRRRVALATPTALEAIRRTIIAISQGRNTLEAELEMRDFAGEIRPMMVRWWSALGEGGLELQQSAMVFVDLGDLKRAEADLAAEKERLAVTLRAMTEGVITTDVDGVVQFMNAAASHLIGRSVEEAIGRSVVELCVLEDERTGSRIEVPVRRVAEGDHVADLPTQTRLSSGNGVWRMVRGCCAPIHSAASTVIGTVLVLRDVTEHERLEQELVRATRLESVGILAGGIAHDFNNILTAIMGNISLAQLDVDPKSPAGRSLQSAEAASLRARDLTQQLLTFAKGGEPVRSSVQLADIIREMAAFALHGSRVRPEFDLAPELWPADADRGQIGRVVQNLVINAVQAMPEGGTVRLRARNVHIGGLDYPALTPGPYVCIEISDTGVGIRSDHLSRIFDPYFTTKQAGSGLGLAAVYSIVRKHDGHIEVQSQLGEGSTFRLWLPAAGEPAEPASAIPPPTTAALSGRLLFMDDEEVIRAMASTLLRRCGFEVTCAADGAEAVRLYRNAHEAGTPFGLVIMDLTVPGGIGGKEALSQLREIDPEVRAIVSSGYSSDPVLANYRNYGFRGVVAKPYEHAELIRVLRDVLLGPSKPGGSNAPFTSAQARPRQN